MNQIQQIFRKILIFTVAVAGTYKLIQNRRRGINLFYNGYTYRRKASNRSSTNWVCAKAAIRDSNRKWISCPARCVTKTNGAIKLTGQKHSHPP